MHYHNPKLTKVANEMRHKPTAAEKKLWYALLKDYTPKFQRQKSILRFVADFYCASAKLVIEIDGGYHTEEEQALRDAARTELMDKLDIKVIRFTNEDIEIRLQYVASVINKVLSFKLRQETLGPQPAASADLPRFTRKGDHVVVDRAEGFMMAAFLPSLTS